MGVPLSAEIKAHARVTTDGDARAMLEKWVEKAEGLEAASYSGAETRGLTSEAAGASSPISTAKLAGLRKAIRDRHIERLIFLLCYQRVTRLGFRDPRLN